MAVAEYCFLISLGNDFFYFKRMSAFSDQIGANQNNLWLGK